MLFKSTRNETKTSSFEALIRGISEDGGLFVPENIKGVEIEEYKNLNYKELCFEILNKFLDIDKEKLTLAIDKAYNKFNEENVIKTHITNKTGFIELFHGPTLAFKDIALTLLGSLLEESILKENTKEKILILTATSGDTGSAALQGFINNEKISLFAMYPKIGISDVQRLQMTTINADNERVFSLEGNFDSAQKIVKDIFLDAEFKEKVKEKGYLLSSANSINIGRLLPQIVYYFASYYSLVNENNIKLGEKIDVAVPTGNFGNILAAYYAKKMGLPIDTLICASNENNILEEFFNTGIYDTDREFKITTSPSMDIIVSSNLERLLYDKIGSEKTKNAMKSLKENGKFNVNKSLFSEFFAGYATEKETEEEIKRVYDQSNYLIDPHTAVGSFVSRKYREKTKSEKYILIAATASPFKFPKVMAKALGIEESSNDFESIRNISKKTGIEIPKIIEKIEKMDEYKIDIKNIEDIKKEIIEYIKK